MGKALYEESHSLLCVCFFFFFSNRAIYLFMGDDPIPLVSSLAALSEHCFVMLQNRGSFID